MGLNKWKLNRLLVLRLFSEKVSLYYVSCSYFGKIYWMRDEIEPVMSLDCGVSEE